MSRVLITGILGLVGSNYAAHCLARGDSVVGIDKISRGKSNYLNQRWLLSEYTTSDLQIIHGDVADEDVVHDALNRFDGVDVVIHCAAQSSVNKSIVNPELDFRSNVIGTFTVLEALRTRLNNEAVFVFVASNKVYDVTHWNTQLTADGYRFSDRNAGPAETRPFYTDAKEPYGASKICGFYYTRCYATMYDMPAVICVPSGMYGPRQFGKEEQGWLGWMVIASELGLPFTIMGDGHQVRDMLHTDDVNSALDLLIEIAPKYKGEVFNLGGGPRNAISLLSALDEIKKYIGLNPYINYTDWRPQDNKCYISNIERMVSLGWHPTVSIQEGIRRMCDWVKSERTVIEKLYNRAGERNG